MTSSSSLKINNHVKQMNLLVWEMNSKNDRYMTTFDRSIKKIVKIRFQNKITCSHCFENFWRVKRIETFNCNNWNVIICANFFCFSNVKSFYTNIIKWKFKENRQDKSGVTLMHQTYMSNPKVQKMILGGPLWAPLLVTRVSEFSFFHFLLIFMGKFSPKVSKRVFKSYLVEVPTNTK